MLEFPWDAIATFIAGIAAVLGAIFVGRRQLEISRGQNEILSRQADILHKQVELEALKFKGDMFSRRLEVFDAAYSYLIAAYNGEDLLGNEKTIAFQAARLRARFLFDDEVIEALEGAHKDGWQYHGLQTYVAANIARGADDPAIDLPALEDAQAAVGIRLTNLPSVFSRHLSIDAPSAPSKSS